VRDLQEVDPAKRGWYWGKRDEKGASGKRVNDALLLLGNRVLKGGREEVSKGRKKELHCLWDSVPSEDRGKIYHGGEVNENLPN